MSTNAQNLVTAAEIARKLGLSQSTVSAVMRGHAERRRISFETKERVLSLAKSLNYVPNQMAQRLRKQRSGMIGVIVGNFSWGWTDGVVRGMLEVLRPSEYTPFVAVHEFDRALAEQELLSCVRRRDEAIICLPLPNLTPTYDRIQRSGTPLLFLGDRPADMESTSFVGWDSGAAARVAVEHLIEIGRQRIAFVGMDYPMEMNLARNEAYVRALRAAGLPGGEEYMVIWPFRTPLEQIVEGSIQRLFDSGSEPPDAIFAVNDAAAVSLMESLEVRGVRVPEDVAIVGLGDLPTSGYRGVGLSTVREPCEEMGREAAQAILKLIRDPDQPAILKPIPGTELKRRRSTLRSNVLTETGTAENGPRGLVP